MTSALNENVRPLTESSSSAASVTEVEASETPSTVATTLPLRRYGELFSQLQPLIPNWANRPHHFRDAAASEAVVEAAAARVEVTRVVRERAW